MVRSTVADGLRIALGAVIRAGNILPFAQLHLTEFHLNPQPPRTTFAAMSRRCAYLSKLLIDYREFQIVFPHRPRPNEPLCGAAASAEAKKPEMKEAAN